jgi:D-beta-D-heptose 7-phosphate kinase/D-beta-D-heptose 1-phosphate adenosyltransferase
VLSEAVVDAVAAASAFVAGGGASSFAAGTAAPSVAGGPSTTGSRGPRAGSPSTSAVLGLAAAARTVAAVRRRGGTVVATGGCFDILHAGHVQLLTSARALGDCLVVCVNSDRSVRQLKGPSRPVVPEADRVAMLAALVGVDAVVTFDEPTPVSALSRLRPDVFVKGGDYGSQPLPETEALARWGGQVVVVPYLDGRSTTGVLRQLAKLRP